MFLGHNVNNLHLSGRDKLIQTGGAFFAPASSISVMVSMLLNQSRLLPVAAYLQGGYGLKDVVIGVPCWLRLSGIESVLELNFSDRQIKSLHISAQSVRQQIERSRYTSTTIFWGEFSIVQATIDLIKAALS